MTLDLVTPTAMLARVREVHPDLDQAADQEDPLIPAWSWSAGAPFAAAVGLSTAAGEALIRDALTLRHRLPRVWGRVLAGEVPVWRARRIAREVTTHPADVAAWLDETLSPVADRVGIGDPGPAGRRGDAAALPRAAVR